MCSVSLHPSPPSLRASLSLMGRGGLGFPSERARLAYATMLPHPWLASRPTLSRTGGAGSSEGVGYGQACYAAQLLASIPAELLALAATQARGAGKGCVGGYAPTHSHAIPPTKAGYAGVQLRRDGTGQGRSAPSHAPASQTLHATALLGMLPRPPLLGTRAGSAAYP